jgi:hypothetical protein
VQRIVAIVLRQMIFDSVQREFGVRDAVAVPADESAEIGRRQ